MKLGHYLVTTNKNIRLTNLTSKKKSVEHQQKTREWIHNQRFSFTKSYEWKNNNNPKIGLIGISY